MARSKIVCLIAFSFLLHATVSALELEKIVGDVFAKPNEIKYIVAIFSNTVPICGGSIINDKLILSVAECFFEDKKYKDNKYEIVAGTTNMYTTEPRARREIVTVYTHKKYENKYNDEYNIAIAKLESGLSIQYSHYLAEIDLPKSEFQYHESLQAVVAGYGVNNNDQKEKQGLFGFVYGSTDGLLRLGDMKFETDPDYTNLIRIKVVKPERGYFRGTCHEDEGNAIVKNNVAIALVTSNNACDLAVGYGMALKVAPFKQFIEDVIKGYQKPDIVVHHANSGVFTRFGNWLSEKISADHHKLRVTPAPPFKPPMFMTDRELEDRYGKEEN